MCVGYGSPITYRTDSLVNWLADTQQLVPDVVGYFSHNYLLTDKALGKTLKTDVLPHLQSRFMAVTSMEREFGNMIYLHQPGDCVTDDITSSM